MIKKVKILPAFVAVAIIMCVVIGLIQCHISQITKPVEGYRYVEPHEDDAFFSRVVVDIDAECGYTISDNGAGFDVVNKNGDIVLKGNFLRASEAERYVTFAKTGEELGVAGIHASDSYVCWYVESDIYPYKIILLSRFGTGAVSDVMVESKEYNAVKHLSVKGTYWWNGLVDLMLFPMSIILFAAILYLEQFISAFREN